MQPQTTFKVEDEYKKYKNVLKNAKQGEVVTRFAPEPSGYLHIGHVKAALITYHYAKMYGGKMILRFDDTNPSKEKQEFVDSIQEDLKSLGISWEKITYTSDNFEYFEEEAIKMIKNDLAYCDNTPVEQMREERNTGIESKCRNQSIEENLRLFQGMKNALHPDVIAKKLEEKKKPAKFESKAKDGQVKQKEQKEEDLTDYSAYCLRAKISMTNKNKCMRDPVLYRCNFTPHHRTGTKYKIYPTYDFACPLLDSREGVTHAMRSMEYTDRVDQFNWVIKKSGVRPVNIFEFSRLGFVNIILSKRKLKWFVESGRVDGWDDARMPTVRGILRRGLRAETLTEFMLAQGPSRKPSLMEWDKIWAMNKKTIDPICPRFTCLRKEKLCKLTILNGPEQLIYTTAPLNPIKQAVPELKKDRPVPTSKNMFLDYDDASNIENGEKITLIKFGNVVIKSKKQVGDALELTAEHLPEDKDFKKTQKLNWLSQDADLVTVNLIELDHLINVDKVDDEDNFEKYVNDKTRFTNPYFADPMMRNFKVDDVLQFERRGYYRVDKVTLTKEGDKILDLIFTPDGSTKQMNSNATVAVDAKKLAKGKEGASKADEKKAQKEQQRANNKATVNSSLQLTTVQGNFRGLQIEIIGEMTKQNLDVKYLPWSELKSKEVVNNNPLGQIPFLKTPEGVLTQTSAIFRYLAVRANKLYGSNDFEKSQIDQWVDFASSDLNKVITPLAYNVWGYAELSAQQQEDALKAALPLLEFLNNQLKGKAFIVGKNISIADICLFCWLAVPFKTFLSAEFRKSNQYLTSWFENIASNKVVTKYYGKNRYPAQHW